MANNVLYANTKQLDEIADLLKGFPKDGVKVMNSVISRASDTVRVEVGRQIPKVYGVPQKEIREALNSKQRKVKTIMGASGEGSVSVVVMGRPLTLTRFRHTPTSSPQASKGKKRRVFHVRAMIRREGGMVSVGPVHGMDGKIKNVFLIPTKSGSEKYLFAYRTGAKNGKREKLKVIRTLSIPQMVTNEQVGQAIVEQVNQTVFKRLTHELDRAFGNLGTNLAGGK